MSAADRGYVALVNSCDVAPLLFWVSIARLMYGVLPLSLLLLLSQARHSYADAGAALAAYGLAAGLLGPARARLCDRRGAHRVVPVLALGLVLAIAVITQVSRAPLPVVVVLALVAGCMAPPVGPLMRMAWRRTWEECSSKPGRRRRPYSSWRPSPVRSCSCPHRPAPSAPGPSEKASRGTAMALRVRLS